MNALTMKAIVSTGYGSPEVLQLQSFAKPTPKENELLIRIVATPITTADTMMRKGTPFYARFFLGLMKPRNPIPGTGFAGVVESVGDSVLQFRVGDEVFGETKLGFGANAEYICIPEDGLVIKKPRNISFEEAAPVCDGALTSFNFLKHIAQIQAGQKILINGASGSLGTAAVQLAAYFGAEVTGVCSTKNIELVQSLGAHQVIDYTQEDLTQIDSQFDIIYDTVGKLSYPSVKHLLAPNGIFMSPVLSLKLLVQMIWTSYVGDKKVKFSATGLKSVEELRPMLNKIKELMQENTLKLLVDKRFSLEEAVEAHRYVDTGHKRGNVVVVI